MTPLDNFQKRYLEELTAATAVLESLESAAQAEAWASGAVAEWRALAGPLGALSSHVADSSAVAAALIDWFEGGPAPERDGEHQWIAGLGRHQLTRVVQLSQPDAPDEVGLILEYGLDGEHDHDLSVSIERGHLVGITIGPPGLSEEVDASDELQAQEVEVSGGLELIRAALELPITELSATSEANIPLLVRRLGAEPVTATTAESKPLPARDRDDDMWCVEVLQSALRTQLGAAPPDSVGAAVAAFGELLNAGDPDALTLLEVAGLDNDSPPDLDTLLAAVGAYVAPVDLSAHSADAFDALTLLEPVDWLGAVLGLVRSPQDHPPIDGSALVTFINKAPEITTTISRREAPPVAWAFEQMLFAWETTGVLTDLGAVTEAGRWLLGQAFVRALSLAPGA